MRATQSKLEDIPAACAGQTGTTTQSANAFTMIELLVVITIITILAGMLLPGLNMAREKAKQTKCAGNCHQIDVAIHNYIDDHNDCIPYVADAGFPSPVINYWSENFQDYIHSEEILKCPSLERSFAVANHIRCDYGRNYSHISTKPPMVMTKLRCIQQPEKVMELVDSKRNSTAHDDSWLVYCPSCTTTNLTKQLNVHDRHNGFVNVTFFDGHMDPRRWVEIQSGPDRDVMWFH